MSAIRPEIMFAELERQHYDRLDEAARIEEEAIRAVDADPDEIPALVTEEMLLDAVRDIFVNVQHPTVAKWKAIMRNAAIEWQIDQL